MQFLKILFWALMAFVAAVFTFGNWKWVPVQLFGNLVAEVNLPLLLLVTFLLGFLPTLIYQRTIRWRLRQRLNATERTLASLQAPAFPAPVAIDLTAPVPLSPVLPAPIPPSAVPSAVPPGVG